MWSDRDDENELPADPPQLGIPTLIVLAAVVLIGFGVFLAFGPF